MLEEPSYLNLLIQKASSDTALISEQRVLPHSARCECIPGSPFGPSNTQERKGSLLLLRKEAVWAPSLFPTRNFFKEKLAAKHIFFAMMLVYYLLYSYPQNLFRQHHDRITVLGSELKCEHYEQKLYLVCSLWHP